MSSLSIRSHQTSCVVIMLAHTIHEFHRMKDSTDSPQLLKKYYLVASSKHRKEKESKTYTKSWKSCDAERLVFHRKKSRRKMRSSNLRLIELVKKSRLVKAQMWSMSLPETSRQWMVE